MCPFPLDALSDLRDAHGCEQVDDRCNDPLRSENRNNNLLVQLEGPIGQVDRVVFHCLVYTFSYGVTHSHMQTHHNR